MRRMWKIKVKETDKKSTREIYEGPGERVAIDFHDYEDGSNTKEKTQMLIACRATGFFWDFYHFPHSLQALRRSLRRR
jgi:hypothetical protein